MQPAILAAAAVALPMRRALTGLSRGWLALQESLLQQPQVRAACSAGWKAAHCAPDLVVGASCAD
jgi:hypothetical protein